MLLRLLAISLFLGATACSESNNHHSQNRKWSIETPQLVSQSSGTQYSLRELEIKRPTALKTGDFLLFSGATHDVSIQVQTVCNLAEQRARHQTEFKLKRQLFISEITPIQARHTANWICSFQFTARHLSGSEHYFELNQYVIEDETENSISVVQSLTSQTIMDRIYEEEAHKTYFINSGVGTLQMLCDDLLFKADENKKIVRLNEFLAEQKSTSSENSLCRAFEISNENLILASSNFFWLVQAKPHVEVRELHAQRRTYKNPHMPNLKSFISWGIENGSGQTLYLAFQKNLEPELFKIMTHYNLGFNAEAFYMPVGWHSNAKKIPHPDYYILEIPRGTYTEVKLGTEQKWLCGAWEQGTSVSPGKNDLKVMILNQVDEISNRTLIETLDLNFYQEMWIGMSQRNSNGFNGIPKAFGPEDNISTLPVQPNSERHIYCNML